MAFSDVGHDETQFPLELFVTATFDANGQAVAQLAPALYGERWWIQRYTTSSTSICRLSICKNRISRETIIDETNRANESTGGIEIEMRQGETLFFLWTFGTVGALVSGNVQGRRFVKGNRGYGGRGY